MIRSVWKHSASIAREMGEHLVWDEVGLGIATEIASGQTTIAVDFDAGELADTAVGILADWQAVVPGVRSMLRYKAFGVTRTTRWLGLRR